MLAKILIHPNLDERLKIINQLLSQNNFKNPHPDLLYFSEDEKLGVEQAKKAREHFTLKPLMAKGRALVFEDASKFTLDAQNALLKTFEEPPEQALILLGASNESKILPTILSRCEVINLGEGGGGLGVGSKFDSDIEKLITARIKEKFEYIEKLEERDEFLQALVVYFREKLHKDQSNLEFTKKLLQAEEWAKANVNLRGILEYLMLEMP